MIYCNICGTQNPDGASSCSYCGGKLAAAATTAYPQPVYQPTYPQPVQTQSGRSTASKISIISVILIALGLVLVVVSSLAMVDSSGSDSYVYYGLDWRGFDGTMSDDKLISASGGYISENALEGEWRLYDGYRVMYIDSGLADTYYAASDELSAYCFEDYGATVTPSVTTVKDGHIVGTLELSLGFRKHTFQMHANDKLMLLFDEDSSIVLYRGTDVYDTELGKQLVGQWAYDGATFTFNEDGTGSISGYSNVKFKEWYIIDDYLVYITSNDYYDIYHIELEGDDLTLSYFSMLEIDDAQTAEWLEFELTRK